MALANSITSTVAFSTVVANGFKLVGAEWIWPAITSVIAVISSIITLRFKDGVLEDKALFCKQYAAKCRNIRNMYEAILADAKASRYTIDQLCSKRDELAELENALFSGEIAPHTTPKAIELAKESLIQNRDTQTEDHEIKAIVPTHLQEL